MLFWHRGDQPAMIAYAKELKLDNSYMISYNGAVITDLKEDKIIFEQMLTQIKYTNYMSIA
jgi:hydroxymethylpyrimidine pyrophosphatase-like HAD family hydrolase